MRKHHYFTMAAILAVLCAVVLYTQRSARNVPESGKTAEKPRKTGEPRPREWAQKIEKPGLPNLHRVSEDLYRSAQPTAEGMSQLKAMGIKTVVNLRSLHSDKDEIGDTGLESVAISMKAWHAEDEDIAKFLKIVADPQRHPVLVHCQHGADRTGTMCAIYRIVVCGWPKDEAIREMTEGGFNFHDVWRKELVGYLDKLDVEKIKREAGLAK